MVKVKTMNQKTFDKMSNDFVSFSELIKTRQEEKQSVLDEYDLELKRFKSGQISEDALESSMVKKNRELANIDRDIENAIRKGLDLSKRMVAFARDQKPVKYKVILSGISGGGVKKNAPKKNASKKSAKEVKSEKDSKSKKKAKSKKEAESKKKADLKKKAESKKKEEAKKVKAKKSISKKKATAKKSSSKK